MTRHVASTQAWITFVAMALVKSRDRPVKVGQVRVEVDRVDLDGPVAELHGIGRRHDSALAGLPPEQTTFVGPAQVS